MTETWNFESCNVYKQVVREKLSSMFYELNNPFVTRHFCAHIARELKTDKRSLQLKKKTHHERKHKVQGSEGKYSHHT